MRFWLTIEPTKEELDDLLLNMEKDEGVSKTPLKAVIKHAVCLMSMAENQGKLTLATIPYRGGES